MPIEPSIDPAVVCVSGEIDLSNVGELDEALAKAVFRRSHVTVRVQDVTFMGLEGARALLRAAESLPEHGRLYVMGPSPTIMRVMDILEAARHPKLVLLPEC